MGVPNKAEIKGKIKKAKGTIKEEVGHAVGNRRMENQGAADRRKGDVQETVGKARRKVGDAVKDVGEAFHPDGRLLAAGSLGQSIVIWRLGTGAILKKLYYRDIGYHTVAFSPRGQWLALGSRDLQLWLKVILTEEEYQAVKAAEERAASATHREDLLYAAWPTPRA